MEGDTGQENRDSVLDPQGTKFWQPEEAWEVNSSPKPPERIIALPTPGFWPHKILSIEPYHCMSDF